MHDHDRGVLEAMCGGLIPRATHDLYELYRAAHDRIGSGAMHQTVLMVIAVESGAIKLPKKEAHPFDNVDIGSFVSVREEFNRNEYCQGIFVGIASGMFQGQVAVSFFGDMDNVLNFDPDRVKVLTETPHWATHDEPKPRDNPREPDSPKSDNDDPDAVDLSNHPFSKVAPGTKVCIAPPGAEMQFGNFISISGDEVAVLLEKGPKNKRRKLFRHDYVRVEKDLDTNEPIVEFDKVSDLVDKQPELVTMDSASGGADN
jgi:hypothetical protein